jgi:predicted DNA-binding transcriptional regulator AlpA
MARTGAVLLHRRTSVSTMSPLLDLTALSRLLGRSPETVRRDLRRNPEAVPPRVQLPGTRLLRWREADVQAWLERHVAFHAASQKGGAQ